MSADELPHDFVVAMNDDVNVSGATAALFGEIHRGNTLLAGLGEHPEDGAVAGELRGSLLAVRAMLDTLGLDPLAEPWVGADAGFAGDARGAAEHEALESLVAEELKARSDARAAKDFAAADAIRDRLEHAGLHVEDGPKGSTWSVG